MSVTITDNSQQVLSAAEQALNRALEAVGLQAETIAKHGITQLKAVDTGRLRNSISHAADKDKKCVFIGTNVEYAAYVELGTSKMGARPFLRFTCTQYKDDYLKIFKTFMNNA